MDIAVNGPEKPKPSWRKPAGIIVILVYIGIWTAIIASQAGIIGRAPIPVQAIIYLAAGIIWIIPLRPLMIWMETGAFTAPEE